jgi:hypothetical protein
MKILMSVAAVSLLGSLQGNDNPAFKYWSEWKPGAWAKYKTVADAGGQKIEIETTLKLLEISAEKAVLESTSKSTVGGRERSNPSRKQEIKAKDPKMGAIDKEGDETIEAGGKSYKCHWIVTSQESPGGKVTMKFWFAKEIPGGIVQSEVGSEGALTAKMQLQEFGEK